MPKTTTLMEVLPNTFEKLCRLHWPRPIHDAVDYDSATEMVDRLALLSKRTEDQDDYLEALSTLIEKYDKDLLPAVESDGGDVMTKLKYLMEGQNMSASDLGRLLGNRTLGAAILRGERKISRANAQVLGDHFKVNPALFFQL
jgi:antitoxin component HigA of HigAB toxin-antitoxin module